nr:hypothetical protein [Tanacetum cinerariifolium]
MPYMEERGSAPDLPNLHHFRAARERSVTIEEAKLQMQKVKRLAGLKVKKEKYEKKIKRVLTPEQIRAREEELDKNATNDLLLRNLKAKFQWVGTTTRKLGISPPYQLTAFETTPTKKKKRKAEVLHEVFVKENIMVDGMKRN